MRLREICRTDGVTRSANRCLTSAPAHALRHARGMQGKLSFEAVQQLATEELLEKYIDSRYGPGLMEA